MSESYLTSHWLIVSSVPLLLLASSCSVMMLQQSLCFDSLQITISQVSAPAFKQGICLLGQGQKGIVVMRLLLELLLVLLPNLSPVFSLK